MPSEEKKGETKEETKSVSHSGALCTSVTARCNESLGFSSKISHFDSHKV